MGVDHLDVLWSLLHTVDANVWNVCIQIPIRTSQRRSNSTIRSCTCTCQCVRIVLPDRSRHRAAQPEQGRDQDLQKKRKRVFRTVLSHPSFRVWATRGLDIQSCSTSTYGAGRGTLRRTIKRGICQCPIWVTLNMGSNSPKLVVLGTEMARIATNVPS